MTARRAGYCIGWSIAALIFTFIVVAVIYGVIAFVGWHFIHKWW